jgi:ubiquinone/menaquinone biosynthesis C-methylase UbiE
MTAMDWSAQAGSGPATYDDFLVPAMFTPLADRMVAALDLQPGARVLDVACGTGALSRALVAAGAKLTGVDLGEPMLAIARANVPDGEFAQGDAAALPVPDDAFDAATCQQGLQFFPDRAGALRELRRAVRPGGRVAVATWGPVDETPFGPIAAALARHLGDEAGAMMRSPFSLHDPEQVASLLRDAGFDDVEARTEVVDTVFASYGDFARRAIGAGPLDPTFRAAPADVQQAIADDITRDLAPMADGDRVRTTMPSVVATARA